MTKRRLGTLARLLFCVALLTTAALPVIGLPEVADARPGSGQSYQGPTRSSSPRPSAGSSESSRSTSFGSSGVGDDVGAEFAGLFIHLLFAEPQLAIALLVIVALVFAVKRSWAKYQDWSTDRQAAAWAKHAEAGEAIKEHLPEAEVTARSDGPRTQLSSIASFDEDFSLVLLDDFVQALFVRVHEARGETAMQPLLPYLSVAAHAQLQEGSVDGIDQVVIGAMHYSDVDLGDDELTFVISFEANLSERVQGKLASFYVKESWTFARLRSVKSRPFGRARSLDCPNCGGSLKDPDHMKCRYCGLSLSAGEFDWQVKRIDLIDRTEIAPTLATYNEEKGNKLPTVVTPGARERYEGITKKDPDADWKTLSLRIRFLYEQINAAWSDNQLERARPCVSDSFFRIQNYWMREYQKQGLRNSIDNAHLDEIELSDARSDTHYDSVTVRIFAAASDYIVRTDSGAVVAGSKGKPRAYSEYWTLIRGAEVKGRPRADRNCPNCGSELTLNQAGECGSCKVHITAGEFDWVLSRIEQDEAYEA